MKKLFLFFACAGLLSFGACATSAPRHAIYAAPRVQPVKTAVTRATIKVSSAQAHAKTASTAVTSAQTHAAAATTSLTELQALVATDTKLNPLAVAAKGEVDALTQNLTSAQTEVASLQVDLADAQTAHQSAQGLADQLQTKVDTQTNQLNEAVDNANKAIAQDAIDRSHAHRLKLYLCSLGAGLAFFVLWKFKAVFAFLGPYAVIALAAGPVAIFGLLWLLL